MAGKLTHIDATGAANMVDVGDKADTVREASAEGHVRMLPETFELIRSGNAKKGDVLGYVSNDFGGTPTTLHLHFEIRLNTAENGWQYAPPYSSLLEAYKRRENNPGERVADDFLVASTPR